MRLKLLFFIFITTTFTGVCQNNKPTSQSNYNIEFNNFLGGVKYAYLAFSDEDVQKINDNVNGFNTSVVFGILDYLKVIGFEDVKWGTLTNMSQNLNSLSSLCDLVTVIADWHFKDNSYTKIRLAFFSCNNDKFLFEGGRNIKVSENINIHDAFYERFLEMYGTKKKYNSSYRLNLPSEMTKWTEEELKNYLKVNGADPIEGIYENTVLTSSEAKYKLGLLKIEGIYNLVYLSGATNYMDWQEGEIKAKLSATATPNLFKADWKMIGKKVNTNAYMSFEPGLMNLVMQGKDKSVYLKLYPTLNDNITIKSGPASGTGFAVSSNGLVITNHHVVIGATSIKVRGINGDFSKTYNAQVIIDDKNNDLAIIKIEDSSFKFLGDIPFVINNKTSDVGSSIFVLGYPLRASMGDEIKLTNGIISSKSGFQGDVTSYQISAPIQPGNSGGPLFDNNGNLIGIVNAKHAGAENASYAIKASYLFNLFDLMPTPPKLQSISKVTGKPLPEQVKFLKEFIYIIEIN